MKIRWFILTIAFLLTVLPPLNAQNRRASKYVVTFNSFGSLKIGMTFTKASKALGVRLLKEDEIGDCYYVRPKRGFKGIGFMVNNGSIARIDVSERTYATDRGVMIGDSEARIKRLYKGQYKVSKHFYTDGHNIEVKMKGGKFSIIFETDGKRVTYMRAGRSPEIQLVEGCS